MRAIVCKCGREHRRHAVCPVCIDVQPRPWLAQSIKRCAWLQLCLDATSSPSFWPFSIHVFIDSRERLNIFQRRCTIVIFLTNVRNTSIIFANVRIWVNIVLPYFFLFFFFFVTWDVCHRNTKFRRINVRPRDRDKNLNYGLFFSFFCSLVRFFSLFCAPFLLAYPLSSSATQRLIM